MVRVAANAASSHQGYRQNAHQEHPLTEALGRRGRAHRRCDCGAGRTAFHTPGRRDGAVGLSADGRRRVFAALSGRHCEYADRSWPPQGRAHRGHGPCQQWPKLRVGRFEHFSCSSPLEFSDRFYLSRLVFWILCLLACASLCYIGAYSPSADSPTLHLPFRQLA